MSTNEREDIDPYGSQRRIEEDKTGVRVNHLEDDDRLITFHSVVGNRILVINTAGDVVMEFGKPPLGYTIYRPGKAGASRHVVCILIREDDRRKRCVAAVDQRGRMLWRTSHHWLTHDFNVKGNGRIWSVIREDRYIGPNGDFRISDNIVIEMDMTGQIFWSWSTLDHLLNFVNGNEILESTLEHQNDNPFHVNSLDFADYQCSDELFGEPVVVISSRNMNKVFLVGYRSRDILYELNNTTIGQHHARILPETFEKGGGNLIIFDNGKNFMPLGQSRDYSRVIEVDTRTNEICWEYRSKEHQPHFYSPIVGAQQRLPNGNTLITEGYFGRIFEIDYNGNLVWDYVYPESNPPNTPGIPQTGLRQIYRAYKIRRDWVNVKRELRR